MNRIPIIFFAILECRLTKYTKFKFDPVLAVFFAPLYGKVKKNILIVSG